MQNVDSFKIECGFAGSEWNHQYFSPCHRGSSVRVFSIIAWLANTPGCKSGIPSPDPSCPFWRASWAWISLCTKTWILFLCFLKKQSKKKKNPRIFWQASRQQRYNNLYWTMMIFHTIYHEIFSKHTINSFDWGLHFFMILSAINWPQHRAEQNMLIYHHVCRNASSQALKSGQTRLWVGQFIKPSSIQVFCLHYVHAGWFVCSIVRLVSEKFGRSKREAAICFVRHLIS